MAVGQSPESTQVMTGMYSDHHGWLFNWLCKKLSCPDQAADMVQDTFCRLFGFSGLQEVREPRALLVTTATRLIIDAARSRKIEKKYLETYAYYHGELMSAPSAEELAQVSDTLLLIARMLDGLPVNVRNAFLMNRLDGMKYADIAVCLDVSASSVKKYIAKAMVHCYLVLEQDAGIPA
ncbi:putative RNA polymerase sigma factor FecI [Thalassocella blandensis]|nr:putative RNA polymerase sigma factor FecI [Thalassocella blandensis]